METARNTFKFELKKSKGLRSVLVVLIAICLNLVYLAGAIQYAVVDEGYFDKTFEKMDSRAKVGLNEQDFEAVKMKLIDYVGLRTEVFSVPVTIDGKTVDFFNDKERSHMVDVRNLFILNDIVLKASLMAIGLIYAAARYGLKYRKVLAEGLAISAWFMIGFVVILAILASQDFTAIFTKFHELFFTNDLWLLDPNTDRMIVLLEEQFFLEMALHIGLYAGLIALFGTAVGLVTKRSLQ